MNGTRETLENEKGATTVEAAAVIFPFLVIIFGIIQLSVIAFEAASLQYTLNKAARWGVLGYTVEDPDQAGVQLARGDSISEYFFQKGKSFFISDENVQIYYCPVSDPQCSNSGNPPGSQQWMIVRAEKPVPSFFGVAPLAVSASVLAMNEPF